MLFPPCYEDSGKDRETQSYIEFLKIGLAETEGGEVGMGVNHGARRDQRVGESRVSHFTEKEKEADRERDRDRQRESDGQNGERDSEYKKILNRVDSQLSEKRSKTHNRLKERFLIGRNRTKRAN